MFREFLKAKIHRAAITQANLNYSGSLSIDEDILEMAGILHNERIHIYNINTGQRFETYAIKGKRGSGEFGLNGAAARLGSVGDLVIIVAYCYLSEDEIEEHHPRVLLLDEGNIVKQVLEE